MKENANFTNTKIEFSFNLRKENKAPYPYDKSLMDFINKPFLIACLISMFAFVNLTLNLMQSEKLAVLMSAPMTFPEHVMRWKDNVDANEMKFL